MRTMWAVVRRCGRRVTCHGLSRRERLGGGIASRNGSAVNYDKEDCEDGGIGDGATTADGRERRSDRGGVLRVPCGGRELTSRQDHRVAEWQTNALRRG